MNISSWKIFDKSGSPINWAPEPYLELSFSKDSSSGGAEGYLITDPSGIVIAADITKSGFYYSDPTSVSYTYVLDEDNTSYDITSDVSVGYVDVSVFNPSASNTQGIGSLFNIDISTKFIYPSVNYSAVIYLEPVSVGLIETEHLYIFEELNDSLIRPYDTSNGSLLFEMVGLENEIKFFVVNDDTQEITWLDTLEYELDVYADSTPLSINIGFRAEEEGVFERRMRIYNVIDGVNYLMAEIIVNAESIGEDERFRTLLGNFGLPDPKDIPRIFKEADINESFPDYKIINPTSKYMILNHDQIIPFVGTYKGLINAIKWLGYDDVYIREWFKNVKENKKLSLAIPYEAKDRTQTILKFSPDERKVLKKLNQLSLVYCINRETGEIDKWGTPETENCFEYNLEEIFIKLLGLKKWLEKNIIGVQARIIDLTGEGIYFERFVNLTYSTDNRGYSYKDYQSLSPYTNLDSELIYGDASIEMSLSEFSKTKLEDLPYRIFDFIDYVWNPNDPSTTLSPLDASYLADPSSYVEIGPPISHPFVSLQDIQWKASVEQPNSGVVPAGYVTNPLWVYKNKIWFYNIFDSSSIFIDSSINLDIVLEKAYIIDASGNDWLNNNQYFIYEDPSYNGYIIESSTGVIYKYDDFVSLDTDTSALLQYAVNDTYKVPLLSFKNFKSNDASDNQIPFETDKLYHLDILDGKIVMNTLDSSGLQGDRIYYINFSYDYSTFEQKVTLNVEYYSDRVPLYVVDPSIYYWADPSHLSGGNDPSVLSVDNSIYIMTVNHTGNYNVEVFAWDGYNVMFTNPTREPHNVYIKSPTIYNILENKIKTSYADASLSLLDVSILNNNNFYPIFEREYPYTGLTLEYDSSDNAYIKVPAITYFNSAPIKGSTNKFYTASEKVKNVSGNIIEVIPRYQEFLNEDDIILFKTYKGSYLSIAEASSHITSGGGTSTLTLDSVPSEFIVDVSHDIYILNDTTRSTSNGYNDWDSSSFVTDVSSYIFADNQLVNLLVSDACSGYIWGASYRVKDVSGNLHTFDGLLPQFIVDNSTRYTIDARHAYSTFVNYEIDTSTTVENNNNFEIYLEKDYRQYFIDSTFVMLNIDFGQEYVADQWYDPSISLNKDVYYYHNDVITITAGTYVLLRALYDSSTYMLNQKNMFTVKENISKNVIFKVFNESVPFVFDTPGTYDVIAESYDSYGNLSSKTWEGLIKVT